MIMTIAIGQVIQLLIFTAIGYTLSKYKTAGSRHCELLSTLELFVFMPAITFNTYSTNFTLEYISEKYKLIIISVILLLLLIAVTYPISRLLSKDHYERNVFHYSLIIPNYGYMGYALVSSIFGAEMLLNVMLFALPLTIYIYMFGYCILTKTKLSLKKLFNPPVIAMVLGAIVGITGIQIPDVVSSLAEKAVACMAPIAMLLAGMVISEFDFKSLLSNKAAYIAVAMRLLVIPCALVLALRLLSLDEAVIPTLMIYAMPCGLNTIVFPKLVKEDCKTGASLAFLSSFFSCLTIPFCLWIFNLA